uniref:uncharacterized protein LOC117605596 n=1 Tax=Osmia lignaria TaxID=473952 RepID=UPI001478DF38|nr:uncharacterized protein LOC117605596 [Osmia lignaria]
MRMRMRTRVSDIRLEQTGIPPPSVEFRDGPTVIESLRSRTAGEAIRQTDLVCTPGYRRGGDEHNHRCVPRANFAWIIPVMRVRLYKWVGRIERLFQGDVIFGGCSWERWTDILGSRRVFRYGVFPRISDSFDTNRYTGCYQYNGLTLGSYFKNSIRRERNYQEMLPINTILGTVEFPIKTTSDWCRVF